ncbi:MAG: MarC family protein [Thermogutta sp.]|nr:MarC family protein [Thermogutta sp.]
MDAFADFLNRFLYCLLPLFVAVDPIGILPLYLGLTAEFSEVGKRRVIRQSLLTAAIVVIGFGLAGRWVLLYLQITIGDFMMAGGILLFVLAMGDLFATEKGRLRPDPDSLGAVPLGIPLIAGPAVLTTVLLLTNSYGALPALLAAVVNIGLAGVFFRTASGIERVVGPTGLRTASKMAALILAAIGVMMVRRGLQATFPSLTGN